MLEDDAKRPSTRSQLELVKDVAGQAYLAATDTTASATRTSFLAMLLHPAVQARAQAEVDRVVGAGRLPDVDDEKDLPYVQAVVSESLRWIPVAPAGGASL
jgi:cytochrome P450